jgi:hypothetical protein
MKIEQTKEKECEHEWTVMHYESDPSTNSGDILIQCELCDCEPPSNKYGYIYTKDIEAVVEAYLEPVDDY